MWPDFVKLSALSHLTSQIFMSKIKLCTAQSSITVSSILVCIKNSWIILLVACILLWQQGKLLDYIAYLFYVWQSAWFTKCGDKCLCPIILYNVVNITNNTTFPTPTSQCMYVCVFLSFSFNTLWPLRLYKEKSVIRQRHYIVALTYTCVQRHISRKLNILFINRFHHGNLW